VKKTVQKKAPTITFFQVKEKLITDTSLNFLEKAMLYTSLNKAVTAREDSIKREACLIRERLFHKTTSRQKWPKRLVPGSAVEARYNETSVRYEGRKPSSFTKQRDIYNLYMSQLVPPMNKFRSRIEANLGIVVDWKSIDKSKLFISTKFQSFYWRSTHGLIYANKDYKRFGVKEEDKCHCGETQSLHHLVIECQRSKRLFANFQVQYKLKDNLTETEMLMGIDPTVQRTKAVLKKLSILRHAIITHNHRDEVLRWSMVLHKVEQEYLREYGVANKRDKLSSHFKSWNM